MMTNDSKDQGREAFEAAGITSRLSRSTEPGYTDEYEDSHTQFAWRGWQAALATSASALARDEAKELCARCNCWVRPSDDCNLCRSADDAKPVGEASVASVSADALRRNVRLRLKVEKLASLLTKTEEEKRDIVAEENEVTGVRIGWGAWALLRAAIIDVIEHKCEFDEDLAASSAATVSDEASLSSAPSWPEKATMEFAMRSANSLGAISMAQVEAIARAILPVTPQAATTAVALTDEQRAQIEEAICSLEHAGFKHEPQNLRALLATSQAATTAGAQDERACKCRRLGDWKGAHHPLCDRAASSATAPLTSDSDALKDAGESVTLTGAQLAEALDFIAPDRDSDQLETEATIQYGTGHSGKGLYCWITEYPEEGAILLDGTASQSTNGEQS